MQLYIQACMNISCKYMYAQNGEMCENCSTVTRHVLEGYISSISSIPSQTYEYVTKALISPVPVPDTISFKMWTVLVILQHKPQYPLG